MTIDRVPGELYARVRQSGDPHIGVIALDPEKSDLQRTPLNSFDAVPRHYLSSCFAVVVTASHGDHGQGQAALGWRSPARQDCGPMEG